MNSSSHTSCLKVTVNGKKFLITGIRKEVSRKDILCALAKTSDKTLQQFKHGGLVTKEPGCLGDELSKSTSDENLLSLLKGDRETAGDFESLKILNSLGTNAKIVKRESLCEDIIVTRERKRTRSRKKYTRELNVDKPAGKRPEKCTRISKRLIKQTSEAPTYHRIPSQPPEPSPKTPQQKRQSPRRASPKHKQALISRSVDDSDIDSYKQPRINKLKKRQNRCYDDSDVDVYHSLYNIVLDQTIKIQKSRTDSNVFIKGIGINRSSWLEKNFQVYYIDDANSRVDNNNNDNAVGKLIEKSTTTPSSNGSANKLPSSNNNVETMNTSATIIYEHVSDDVDIDNDNDSGLPSPEYDSSESTENQPIRLERGITMTENKIRDKDLSTDQSIDTVIKNTLMKNKQVRDFNENITVETANGEFAKINIEHNNVHEHKNNKNVKSVFATGKLANYNEDVYLQRRSQSLGDLLLTSRAQSGRRPITLHTESDIFTYDISSTDGDDVDAEKVQYILQNLTNDKIINMGVLNPAFLSSTNMKSKKKLEKKKINKADISDPTLLSPTQFRRYGSLKSVQTAAQMLKNGISFGNIGRSVALPTGEKDDERKDKEKFYNKKLSEVRRAKRSSRSSGKSDAPSASHSKTKEKDKIIPPDKPPGDKKSSREKKHAKERERLREHESHETLHERHREHGSREKIPKEKKDSKSHKHRDEHKHSKHMKREKSFDTITTTTTTTTSTTTSTSTSLEQIDDNRSSCSTNSNTEPDSNKKVSINEIERQILELNKLKSQQISKECLTNEKYICHNIDREKHENTSKLLEDSNINTTDFNEEIHRVNDDDNDNDKNDKCVNDDISDALETTSDYSSLNENIKLESFDEIDMERSELLSQYTREEEAVSALIERILDYNLLIAELSEELDILRTEGNSNDTLADLIAEEENIYIEIDSVRSLLQSVIDLCAYQRKEMSENLSLLDKLDTKVRTKKAGYEILKSGEWRTNSKSAPRSLLKYSKEKKATAIVRPNPPHPPNLNSSVV